MNSNGFIWELRQLTPNTYGIYFLDTSGVATGSYSARVSITGDFVDVSGQPLAV